LCVSLGLLCCLQFFFSWLWFSQY